MELIREQCGLPAGGTWGSLTGPTPSEAVVRPLVQPGPGHPRIEFLTRLRPDARLYALPPLPGCRARPEMGPPVATPLSGGTGGRDLVAGGRRLHLWSATACPLEGTGVPVVGRRCGQLSGIKVVVGSEVEGYRQRFHLVSSATELTGVEMVEGFAGRFRQEDLFRDLNGSGWVGKQCRAWTQAPIERTSQVQWVTLSLLRLARVPVGGRRLHGLVVASALESEEGPAQCAGRGAAAATAWLGDPEPAGEMAGQGRGERPGNRRRERLGVRGEDRWPVAARSRDPATSLGIGGKCEGEAA